jgi:transcriptional regulator with XRE-family HTH domain
LEQLRLAYGEMTGRPDISFAEMARILGIQKETYRSYERGIREPPIWILLKIKQLTGCSIDTLLTGTFSLPDHELFPQSIDEFQQMLDMAERIRWVRELKEPDVEKVAAVMRIRLDTWLRFERGFARPNIFVLREFAGRFNVTLDFLVSGKAAGLEPTFCDAVLDLCPRLLLPADRRSARYTSTATRDAPEPDTTAPRIQPDARPQLQPQVGRSPR